MKVLVTKYRLFCTITTPVSKCWHSQHISIPKRKGGGGGQFIRNLFQRVYRDGSSCEMKSFPSVDRQRLLDKLSEYGISQKFLAILTRLYANDSFSILLEPTVQSSSHTRSMTGAYNRQSKILMNDDHARAVAKRWEPSESSPFS